MKFALNFQTTESSNTKHKRQWHEYYDFSQIEDQNIPQHFLCPISLALMLDPVVTNDGHTYERKEIREWFKHSKKSPSTGKMLPSLDLIPNIVLRGEVIKWVEDNCQKKSGLEFQIEEIIENILRSIAARNNEKSIVRGFFSPSPFQIFATNFKSAVEQGDKRKALHYFTDYAPLSTEKTRLQFGNLIHRCQHPSNFTFPFDGPIFRWEANFSTEITRYIQLVRTGESTKQFNTEPTL